MDELTRRKERDKFVRWKHETCESIRPLIIQFFAKPNYDLEMAKKLGRIIQNLHNPYYDIIGTNGKHLSNDDILAMRILLELDIEEFIEYTRLMSQ